MLCILRCVFLLNTVGKSSFLSYHSLPVSSNQSVLWPPSSRRFLTTELLLTGCFLFSGTVLCKLKRLLCPTRPAVSETQQLRSEIFSRHSVFKKKHELKNLDLYLDDIDAVRCCYVIGWSNNSMNEQVFSIKMTGECIYIANEKFWFSGINKEYFFSPFFLWFSTCSPGNSKLKTTGYWFVHLFHKSYLRSILPILSSVKKN